MKGCRPLEDAEIELIKQNLSLRNKTIFVLGIRTGFRVSELLSLDIKDVLCESGIREYVKLWKRNTKNKKESRTLPIHREAKEMLLEYLNKCPGELDSEPLFRTDNGRLDKSVFHRQLKDACVKAGIAEIAMVATHSMRKTFAKKFYEACGRNIYFTQIALGHSSIGVTIRYLQEDIKEIAELILELE